MNITACDTIDSTWAPTWRYIHELQPRDSNKKAAWHLRLRRLLWRRLWVWPGLLLMRSRRLL
jgi:hypothetical protein